MNRDPLPLLVSLIISLLISSEVFSASTQVALSPGEQKIMHLKKPGAITVTNPKAAKVSVTSGQLKITGLRQGISHILMNGKQSDIEVVIHTSKLSPAKEKIEKWLGNIHGISLKVKPDFLIVQGEAFRLNDWHQIMKFKKQFHPYIKTDVRISSELLPALHTAVDDALQKRSLSSTWTTAENGEIEIQAVLNSKEKQAIKEIAEEWGLPEPKTSHSLELKPMVEIDVVIAEVKKNSMRSLGLQLPGSYSATVLPAGDLSSAAVSMNPLEIIFHAGLSQGGGRVLANPKLLCRSGEVAHFIAGGEIPIKIVNPHLHDVTWKRYGVILDITPLADRQNHISTKLTTEVSLIDDSRTIEGIPGMLTNRIETHFDLSGSKTIALSGLIKSEVGRTTNSNSLLGEIPILGELFKSRDYKDSKTELVVFVTPRVLSPYENPPLPKLPQWQDDDL
jgi:pilus assembly protein CpaC